LEFSDFYRHGIKFNNFSVLSVSSKTRIKCMRNGVVVLRERMPQSPFMISL